MPRAITVHVGPLVSSEEVRADVERAGMDYSELARRLGWKDRVSPDRRRVRRVLGISGDSAQQNGMSRATAKRIRDALTARPV